MKINPVLDVPVIFGGSQLLFSTSSIAISPTLGAELVVNGNFTAWTADNPNSWSVAGESAPAREVTEVGPGGAPGVGYCRMFTNTNNAPAITQAIMSANVFYKYGLLVDTVTAGIVDVLDVSAGFLTEFSTTGTKAGTGRALGTSFRLRCGTATSDFVIDDVTLKALSNTNDIHTEPTLFYGDWTINYSRSANYQAGVFACYTDANNYLLLYDDGAGKAVLVSNVAGSISTVGSWAITYGANQNLTLRVHKDGTLDALYNAGTLASGLADTTLRGTAGGAFATDASTVTINSFTWDARSAT